MLTRLCARSRAEDGVTLVMALAFLALFGALVPVLLSLGTTGLLATSRLQEQRATTYVADGATEAAIQYLRNQPNCGRSGYTCPTSSVTWTSGSETGVASFSFAGSAIDFDRTFNITTTVNGQTRLQATVIFRDLNPLQNPEIAVDVKSWRYVR